MTVNEQAITTIGKDLSTEEVNISLVVDVLVDSKLLVFVRGVERFRCGKEVVTDHVVLSLGPLWLSSSIVRINL
jgi:hypothetical protein